MNCYKCGSDNIKVIPPGSKVGQEVKNRAGEKYHAYLKCGTCGTKQNTGAQRESEKKKDYAEENNNLLQEISNGVSRLVELMERKDNIPKEF